jgi:hypothetical protein
MIFPPTLTLKGSESSYTMHLRQQGKTLQVNGGISATLDLPSNWLLRPEHKSEYRLDDTLCPTERAVDLLLALHLHDTLPSLVLWRVDELQLLLAQSLVDIDVLDLDVQRALLRNLEPRPDLPYNVQNKEEGACKVVLEEDGGVEIWPADGIKGDVELGG